MTITVSALTGGSNNYQFTSQQANAMATDFVTPGVVGSFTNTLGVAPATGAFAVNATGSPDSNIQVSAGTAYVTATPNTQSSQALRASSTGTVTVAITANASGSTRFDWVYIKIDPTLANNPDASGTTVATIVTSRSTSSTSDNGTPPTYGYLLAVVTVANGFSSITNANITDKRTQAAVTVVPTAFVDNTVNPSVLFDTAERVFDHVVAGTGVVAQSAGLVGSFTDITYYVSGKRYTKTSIPNRTYTASKDTYVDINTAGTVTYQEVANNATSPSLGASSIRVAIVITSGAAITFVNQGQLDSNLTNFGPTISSTKITLTDSLGNAIYPTNPLGGLIGYREITASVTTNSTTGAAIVGLSMPINVPAGRRVMVTAFNPEVTVSAAAGVIISIWDGVPFSGTEIQEWRFDPYTGSAFSGMHPEQPLGPLSNSSVTPKTYALGWLVGSATGTFTAGLTKRAYIKAEII